MLGDTINNSVFIRCSGRATEIRAIGAEQRSAVELNNSFLNCRIFALGRNNAVGTIDFYIKSRSP